MNIEPDLTVLRREQLLLDHVPHSGQFECLDRLTGEEITPWVQVVGLADAFDALIHPWVYKPAYPGEQASGVIVSKACGIFHPLFLVCFARHIVEISQTVYTSAG